MYIYIYVYIYMYIYTFFYLYIICVGFDEGAKMREQYRQHASEGGREREREGG